MLAPFTSKNTKDHDLSCGVPAWQGSVTYPCCLPCWVRCRKRWSLSTGDTLFCTLCWPPACSAHLETGRQQEGRTRGPCAYTQLEAGADMLPCVSHLPCFLLTSHFRQRGESCSLPWSTAAQWVSSTKAYLRHSGAVEQDIIKHPQMTENNRFLVQWEQPFWACRNNVWVF